MLQQCIGHRRMGWYACCCQHVCLCFCSSKRAVASVISVCTSSPPSSLLLNVIFPTYKYIFLTHVYQHSLFHSMNRSVQAPGLFILTRSPWLVGLCLSRWLNGMMHSLHRRDDSICELSNLSKEIQSAVLASLHAAMCCFTQCCAGNKHNPRSDSVCSSYFCLLG